MEQHAQRGEQDPHIAQDRAALQLFEIRKEPRREVAPVICGAPMPRICASPVIPGRSEWRYQ